MAAEEPLQEARWLEEERRLQEEALREERMNNCIKVIHQISDLKKIRDLTVNRLRRLINQSISQHDFTVVEDQYLTLSNVNSELDLRILDWEELLDLDQEGSPVYPNRGQPEYRYSPEAEDFSNKTRIMEQLMSQCKEVLKTFFKSLPAEDRGTVSLEAKTPFLKNPSVWLTGSRNLDQDNDQGGEQEDEEDEENTVVNGEDVLDRQEDLHDDEEDCINLTPPQSQ